MRGRRGPTLCVDAGHDEEGKLIAPAALNVSGKPADFSMMERQMRVAYANPAKILARFGATLDDVVDETLFVLDVDSAFAAAGKVRKEAYAALTQNASLEALD